MFDRLDRNTFWPASVLEKLSFHQIKLGGTDLARCGVDFQCYQATSLNCSPYHQARGTKRSQFRETNRTIRDNQFRDTSDPAVVHWKIDGSLSEINRDRKPGLENNEPTTIGLRLRSHRSNCSRRSGTPHYWLCKPSTIAGNHCFFLDCREA